MRVYSGKISSKQTIRNSTRNVKEKVFQLLEINANQINENIEEITAGNVGCVVGLKNTRTGDTLVNDKSKFHSYVLGRSLRHVSFDLNILLTLRI